jgi:hypothetical protein
MTGLHPSRLRTSNLKARPISIPSFLATRAGDVRILGARELSRKGLNVVLVDAAILHSTRTGKCGPSFSHGHHKRYETSHQTDLPQCSGSQSSPSLVRSLSAITHPKSFFFESPRRRFRLDFVTCSLQNPPTLRIISKTNPSQNQNETLSSALGSSRCRCDGPGHHDHDLVRPHSPPARTQTNTPTVRPAQQQQQQQLPSRRP